MKLSVIIPTWCEADLIAGTVEAARRIGDEVIVVDGGSTDGTADIVRTAGAPVILDCRQRHFGGCYRAPLGAPLVDVEVARARPAAPRSLLALGDHPKS